MKPDENRTAVFFINAARERGLASLPHLIGEFPETGIKLDADAVLDFACPSCGSTLVKVGIGDKVHQTGSSLRLRGDDIHLRSNIPDSLARGMLFSLVCHAGSCDYAMSTHEFLTRALEAVGAPEFLRRVRPHATADYFPREEQWFAVYLPHARGRGVFMSPRSPAVALGKLSPGAGVAVLVQEVTALSVKDAESKIDPQAWEDCQTDASGALLRAADIERVAAEATAKEAHDKREAEIKAKLAEYEVRLWKDEN